MTKLKKTKEQKTDIKLPKGWEKHRKFEPLSLGVMGYSDEYLCPHGIGHDKGVHGCDGCCSKLEL